MGGGFVEGAFVRANLGDSRQRAKNYFTADPEKDVVNTSQHGEAHLSPPARRAPTRGVPRKKMIRRFFNPCPPLLRATRAPDPKPHTQT